MSCVPLGKPLPSLALSLQMSPQDPRLWSWYLQKDFPPLGLVALALEAAVQVELVRMLVIWGWCELEAGSVASTGHQSKAHLLGASWQLLRGSPQDPGGGRLRPPGLCCHDAGLHGARHTILPSHRRRNWK